MIRRSREDNERGRARRNRRLGEEREKKDEEEEFEVDELDEVFEVDEERAARRRCRAMLTAARREAWREVRWMSAR